jgi:peptidyl-prolyl cis-trans isomerase D
MKAFRNTAKPLIFIVAISFFAWLVLDLSGLTGGTGLLTETSVGKINGKSVDTRVFQQAVAQATEASQRQSAEPLGLAEVAQIRDQVWEQFIQERLLEAEYKRWGIRVQADEVAAAIRGSPPQDLMTLPDFQTDGQFDAAKYERWLASSVGQSYIPALEAQYRNTILQAKLARHLLASVTVSDAALWARFRDENEEARVGLVRFAAPEVVTGTSVTVTPSELEEYYRARRDEFHREAQVWLSFLLLDRRPIGSDTAAALERALSLRAEIRDGAPFAEVAQRESADTVSGNQGGDLGEWTRGTFDADFEQAAFALPLQSVSEPVLTRFGYHLIEITSRAGDRLSGRHILVPIEVTGDHRDQLDARADSLEQLAADRLDPAALDTAARVLGLPIEVAGPITKGQPTALPADASVWAFQAQTAEHSPVVETGSAYFVFRLDSVRTAGVPPLAEIRAEVEARIRAQKMAAQARALAVDLRQHAAGPGQSLERAAGDLNLRYEVVGPFTRPTAPLASALAVGAAFGLEPGEVSGVIEAEDQFYVLQGLSRTAADSAAFVEQLPLLREQALANARSLHLRMYLTTLREQARIVDNRDRIYRTSAQIAAEAGGP